MRAAAISATVTVLPDGIAVEGRFGLTKVLAMALAVVVVLVGEDKLAPLLLDTLVARVKAMNSKGGLFARDSANVRRLVAALTVRTPSPSSRRAR